MVNNIMIKAYVWAQSLITDGIEALKEERGQDLIEYAVLAGAIGIVASIALFAAPTGIGAAITNFGTTIKNCVDISQGSAYTCP